MYGVDTKLGKTLKFYLDVFW